MNLKTEKEYSVSLSKDENRLEFIWKPVLFSQDRFKEIISQFAIYVTTHKTKHLYIDARENKVLITPETQTWHDDTIVPKYIAAGVKKIAFLIPANIFSEMSHVKTFSHQNAISKFETKFFKTKVEIVEWFQN